MKAMFIYENMGFERVGENIYKNLSIGKYKNYEKNIIFNTREELIDTLIELIPLILDTKEIPKDIINQPGYFINSKYFDQIANYVEKYFDEKVPLMDLEYKLEELGFEKQSKYKKGF